MAYSGTNTSRLRFAAVFFCSHLLAPPVLAMSGGGDTAVLASPAKRVLWGDTHLHTNVSLDARAFGATLSPADAYRFARGATVTSNTGVTAKLDRPLDFLVVADHSDAMGVMNELVEGSNDGFQRDPQLRNWAIRLRSGGSEALAVGMEIITAATNATLPDAALDKDFARKIWDQQLQAAEQFNEPGRFTAMIGYEWTSMPGGNNLHRNVLYRDGADLAAKKLPLSSLDTVKPEDLWRWMSDYEKKTGGRVLALAHNGNLSNGWMFPDINPETGKPLTRDYLQQRARWEPIYEITQIKGDGEAHPYLSPDDGFADYETWDASNLGPVLKQKGMLRHEYAREALKSGMQWQRKTGINPYRVGFVGSTDSHTSLATADENNFFGKMAYMEPSAKRSEKPLSKLGDVVIYGWQMTASGYAAVWATDNTREAIFDAMQRREVYATTGPRMVVKFDALVGDARHPMGSELKAADKAPVFYLHALKDPAGATLDRAQIIKGWVDATGDSHERIYDVAWAGAADRMTASGLLALPDTVDPATAGYDNGKGVGELVARWTDPDYNPAQHAFYYARVLEVATPRWTTHDAVRFGLTLPENIPVSGQERAYTSPIWITP